MENLNVKSIPQATTLFINRHPTLKSLSLKLHHPKIKKNLTSNSNNIAFYNSISEILNQTKIKSTVIESPIAVSTGSEDIDEKSTGLLIALWKFLRPHTIRGTIVGSIAVTARALIEHPEVIDWNLLPIAFLGVITLLCGNGYIVGINQIFDVDIDKINKPFLPVAANELSKLAAWSIVSILGATGIYLSFKLFGSLVGSLYSLGLTLGTLYSIPPFRLKRFPIPAFLIIATVRGFLLNFGVYYSVRAALKLKFTWSPAIIFITTFVTLFATVIAITKDLPDIKGDIEYKITTLATEHGVKKIAYFGSGILVCNYVIAALVALRYPNQFNLIPMALCHGLLAVKLLFETVKLNARMYSSDAIQMYYGWIWNLFYLEYILLPFI